MNLNVTKIEHEYNFAVECILAVDPELIHMHRLLISLPQRCDNYGYAVIATYAILVLRIPWWLPCHEFLDDLN